MVRTLSGFDTLILSQDFTYGDDYYEKWVEGDAGGPSLEWHDFIHIDMPLTAVNTKDFRKIIPNFPGKKTKMPPLPQLLNPHLVNYNYNS